MSTDRDVTRVVRSWLDEGVTALPDRVLDAVLDQIPATPQVRSRWPVRRAQRLNGVLKMAFAAAMVAVVVVGISLLPRPGGLGGPAAASPSPTPSPSLQAVRMTVSGTELSSSPLQLTAELPAGWNSEPSGAIRSSWEPPAPQGTEFFVSLADNTFKDPCAHIQRSPRIGTTVDALATALSEVPDLTATGPAYTTIAGHEATYIELTVPASLPCDPSQFYLWEAAPNADWWVMALNEQVRVWILEVRGLRVVIAARSWPGSSDAAKAELQGIVDSIVFDVTSAQPSTSPAAS